jgi:hypothetical protein
MRERQSRRKALTGVVQEAGIEGPSHVDCVDDVERLLDVRRLAIEPLRERGPLGRAITATAQRPLDATRPSLASDLRRTQAISSRHSIRQFLSQTRSAKNPAPIVHRLDS